MARRITQPNGFTLIELAMVLVVLGLLLGGALKGQELVRNARLSSVIQQVHTYEVATSAFQKQYGTYPGDLGAAATRLQNCRGDCASQGSNQNGMLATVYDQQPIPNVDLNSGGLYNWYGSGYETLLFWRQLAAAGLIDDISAEGTDPNNTGTPDIALAGWGVTAPASRVKGTGFIAVQVAAGPIGNRDAVRGIYVVQMRRYTNGWSMLIANTLDAEAYKPSEAHYIDLKMDDGRPLGGRVQAVSATLTGYGCPGADGVTYDDSVGGSPAYKAYRNCNLAFKIAN